MSRPEEIKGPFSGEPRSPLIRVLAAAVLCFSLMQSSWAGSVQTTVREANKLYSEGEYNAAIAAYDEALIDQPAAPEPKFNKANTYYRLDDLGKALDLYRQVAADSKDMKLVAKAKYNLGNTSFQQGIKQKDSDLNKAVEKLRSSIDSWRQVLDIEPQNQKAATNIEVARLIIKDIIDQLNKQKQEQQNQQDQQCQQNQQQNQQQDQSQAGKQDQQKQDQQQSPKQDPNQPEDPNQSQQQQQNVEQKQAAAPDTTADDILDEEQRRQKERQILQRAGYQKVERDW